MLHAHKQTTQLGTLSGAVALYATVLPVSRREITACCMTLSYNKVACCGQVVLWSQLVEPVAVASLSGRNVEEPLLGPSWRTLHAGLRQYSRGVHLQQTATICRCTLFLLEGVYRKAKSCVDTVNQTGSSVTKPLRHVTAGVRNIRINLSQLESCIDIITVL